MSTFISVLSFAVFPAIATVAGAGVALIRSPGPAMRSAVQHFAAGVIFCVLATELLPDLLHRRMPVVTLIGFSLGVVVMLSIRHFAEKKEQAAEKSGAKAGLVAAMGVDIALDGLLIGLAFAAGQKQGLLLTIALVLETFFLGVSCTTALAKAGISRARMLGAAGGLAALLLLGATLGAIALSTLPARILDGILAFGVAALLYLVTEELLVEAHDEPEMNLQTAMFFVGFIVLFTIDMLL